MADRRHAFTANGVLNPQFAAKGPLGYVANNNRVAFIFVATAGDTFNLAGNRNLNGDPSIPASQQRPLFIGRDTVRGPSIYQLDLRYSRIFPIGERIRPEFLAEFTNLLNHSNITGINTTATVNAAGMILTAPNFGPTAALDSRLMQLGVRVSF